jgi:hypothetical protein
VTEIPESAAALEPPANPGSLLGNLFNLYFEPGETFAKIFVNPRVWAAILLQTAMAVAFSSIWLENLNAREFMKAQMEQNSRIQQLPAERVEEIINTQARFMRTWGRIAPFFAPVLVDLVLAGVFMFMFRFFMAADVSYLNSLAVVAWTLAAMSLLQTPIMLLVFWLKGDWNVDPNQIIQANPTLFFEIGSIPRWSWSLLSSFDLFSMWTIFLFATGHAVAGKRGLSTGLWGVGIPWIMYLAVKVGFILMFG